MEVPALTMGVVTVPWAVQGACGKKQDHLSFPIVLTQHPGCTTQILQAVGVLG